MRRALLLFNPQATSVSARVRDVIAHALSTELKLDVVQTEHRHHATELAATAARDGFEVVASLGGDGTLNEVINGLAGTSVAVIPIPGGGTNVFARTLGLPKDPIEATSVVLEHLHAGAQPRRVNLGRVNGRYFAFCAGIGRTAGVVRAVERNSALKRKLGEGLFVAHALRAFLFTRKQNAPLTLHRDGETIEALHEVVVCGSSPFTFLGSLPFKVCPRASLSGGLEVVGLTSVRTPTVLRIVFSSFGRGTHLRFRSVRALHDVDRLVLTSARTLPYQVDGDFAGENTSFSFERARDALSVLV